MKTFLAPRASSILYDVLQSQGERAPFLLPANICPIVPATFFKAGMPFEFVDISPHKLHIDLDRVEARLRKNAGGYGGLLYAHPYGNPYTPWKPLGELKDRYPYLLLIDDRCLCVPDLVPDASTCADVTLYSTGYAKIVDIGFGGFAFVQAEASIAHHRLPFDALNLKALEADYKTSIEAGEVFSYEDSNWLQTDSGLPPWQDYRDRVEAALPASLARRKSLNAVYNAMVPPNAQLPEDFQLWRFNVRVEAKKRVLEEIFKAGLFASSHYASLVGIMGTGDDENARDLAAHVINLFNDQHYSLEMAERTAQIIMRSI